jgi:ribosome-binding protein aMBF1 (putative translation factor)
MTDRRSIDDPTLTHILGDIAAGSAPTKAAREARGLSRQALATGAGTNLGTIDALERGMLPDPILRSTLASALGVPATIFA